MESETIIFSRIKNKISPKIDFLEFYKFLKLQNKFSCNDMESETIIILAALIIKFLQKLNLKFFL